MSDSQRRGHLFLVTDNVLEVHREWVESETAFLTEAVDEAVSELVDVFGTGSMPADCRGLNQRVEELGLEWRRWQEEAALDPQRYQTPGNGFWRALGAVRDARSAAEPRQPVTLESIDELTGQKVSDRQICVIYGFLEPDKTPQLWKLREERAQPGKYVNKTFVAPLERAARDEERRAAEAIERLEAKQRVTLKQANTPPPEPMEKLVADGVSARQIAKMHQVSPEDVIAWCKQHGLEPPPLDYADPHASRQALEKPLSDEEARAFDAEVANPTRNRSQLEAMDPLERMELDGGGEGEEAIPLTLDQQIIELFEQGVRPGEISAAIEDVSLQKVNSVIKRFREQPEAFGAVRA